MLFSAVKSMWRKLLLCLLFFCWEEVVCVSVKGEAARQARVLTDVSECGSACVPGMFMFSIARVI